MDTFFESGALRVKICGVTNAADAALVVDAGADAIGINLFPGSKRFVELDAARDWVRELPLTRVAVVVNPAREDVLRIAEAGCFDAIQFHGDETPGFCLDCPIVWIRAERVSGPDSLAHALEYATQALLLDGFSAAGYGGTGTAVDVDLARDFVRWNPGRQVVLAGGLNPENVARIAHFVHPHGVDVAGGVEAAGDPRRKDADQVRAFVAAAREA